MIFLDTLLSGTKSKRGNKYAEVFVTEFGWWNSFPMDKEGGGREALSMLF